MERWPKSFPTMAASVFKFLQTPDHIRSDHFPDPHAHDPSSTLRHPLFKQTAAPHTLNLSSVCTNTVDRLLNPLLPQTLQRQLAFYAHTNNNPSEKQIR